MGEEQKDFYVECEAIVNMQSQKIAWRIKSESVESAYQTVRAEGARILNIKNELGDSPCNNLAIRVIQE